MKWCFLFSAEDHDVGLGICGWLLTAISWLLVIVTLPFSLCVCFKVTIKYSWFLMIDQLNILLCWRMKISILIIIKYIYRSYKNMKGQLYFDSVDYYREALRAQVWKLNNCLSLIINFSNARVRYSIINHLLLLWSNNIAS